jgi:uncharacterized membrane protein
MTEIFAILGARTDTFQSERTMDEDRNHRRQRDLQRGSLGDPKRNRLRVHQGMPPKAFPVVAGILLGLGLGGFFDGVVLRELLQWHLVLSSAGYPPDSVANLRFNLLWDGLFHSASYIVIGAGIVILWRAGRRSHVHWPVKILAGTVLMGFGLFNLVEGLIDHHILKIHHVNETVPPSQWIYWDIGFLAWGAAMLAGGWMLWRAGKKQLPVKLHLAESA